MPRSWKWFCLEPGEPEWLAPVRDVLDDVSSRLPWVHEEIARWETEHPVPRNATADVRGRLDRVWLLEPALTAAREGLQRRGFQLTGPVRVPALPDEWSAEDRAALELMLAATDRRPWIGRVGARGLPARDVDAWHPTERIAVDIDWSPAGPSHPASNAASLMKLDAAYLVLGRRPGSLESIELLLTRVFEDAATAGDVASKLPLRGVLVVEI